MDVEQGLSLMPAQPLLILPVANFFKGQSIAAYDPRAMQGNAVTYATSPMGADHTAGNVVGEYLTQALDPLKSDGQVEASRNMQIAMAAVDCTGMCLLASFANNSRRRRSLLECHEREVGDPTRAG
jgi:aldehyde:ferredoxin oxidoreductase